MLLNWRRTGPSACCWCRSRPILVAPRSVSESRLAQLRLGGLLDAATKAPDWADPNSIEGTLIEQAEQVLRHSVAELRDEPPGPREIGHQLEIPGKGVRWLVARSAHSSALLTTGTVMPWPRSRRWPPPT